MYATQEIANRIKLVAKAKKIKMSELLSDCELNINAISEFSKGKQLSCISFAKIADKLNCSVDYLLGRVDNPQLNDSTYINGDNNNNGNQAINGNININTGTTEKDDRQLLEMIKSLDIVQRAKIITAIDEIKKNNT